MLLRLKAWYKGLTPLTQLSIAFLVTWIIWFASSLLGDKVFYKEKHSLADHLFNATWMAIFMTPLYAWNKVKAVFKTKRNNPVTDGLEKQL